MQINNNGVTTKTPYKEALTRVGEIVLLSRRRLGIDQEGLAIACNQLKMTSLTQARISDIERGKVEPTWLEVVAIADVMGKDINEFRV
ncbi:helix-turn-helix transcriptional regulator [Aetokthonos hydrillicola Thurmond2011]|jgi:predicted transcriptional regulator|uniref:Helix-turn-helix transcriptional regulator n=1 Tax=Aetokthonos hydrillicola Thurmond2011 TaxID=2712845 RepID=A0AAP5I3S3_9CYAN|nr:helix-turn-helix transcriptional regulator [Aetokthonos hydrillicola]MBO3463123.1 helix-turn-helix transcriptional regulator [Aetokthonos hydrillicola CCALA 1050]MBW4591093.1 helix-turn-helix transcriptional regulator [Aetokthonos hydrillicola CCALA 1050]MDR9893244.1 helix-turn-helix transcriptional regulator [Aetokthonos hydrillicola Thurmond2011]